MQKQALLHQQLAFKKILDSDKNLTKSYRSYVELVSKEFIRYADRACIEEYLKNLTNLHRAILPHELILIAVYYNLHIICQLPRAGTLIFNDESTDVIEIWYDGRYFLREPRPDSLHLYRASAVPQILPEPSLPLPALPQPETHGKDEKSLSAAPTTWKPTVGDGDCAFHAIFGNDYGSTYYCADARDKRGQLAKAIADCFPMESSSSSSSSSSQSSKDEHKAESMVYRLSITGITALVMDQEKPLSGRLLGLRMTYQHWCKQKNELDDAWAQLEIALQKNPRALHFLATQHNLEKLTGLTASQVLRAQLQNICQRAIVTEFQEIIQPDHALLSSYQAYQLQQSLDPDFDWPAAISIDILQEYADFISQNGRYLLPAELEIIAYVFNRRIIFYPDYAANPQIFNDDGSSAVEVWFNGRNHFEREPTPQHQRPAIDSPSTMAAEVCSTDAKGQSPKTKRKRQDDDEPIPSSKLARQSTSRFFKQEEPAAIVINPSLPAKEYEALLALIIGGKEQEARKIIRDFRINYQTLMNTAADSTTISDYFPLFSFLANFVDSLTIQKLINDAVFLLPKIFAKDDRLFYNLAEHKLWELIAKLSWHISTDSTRTQDFLRLLLNAEVCPATVEIWREISQKHDLFKPAFKSLEIPDQHLALALLQKGEIRTLCFLCEDVGSLNLPTVSEANLILFQMAANDKMVLSELAGIYNRVLGGNRQALQTGRHAASTAVLADHGLFGGQDARIALQQALSLTAPQLRQQTTVSLQIPSGTL